MNQKIMLWLGDSPDQCALANKLGKEFNISGIVLERRKTKPILKQSIADILSKIAARLFLSKLSSAWSNMLSYYSKKYPSYPNCPILYTENINSDKIIDFFNKNESSLILVSGTRLIKEKLLELKPSIGIINLHTGLSPYIKGGPNCTNWCISTNQLHLIGNTVMWIDAGIDSGNLISTDVVNFTGNESLNDIHIKVCEHAHKLYINATKALLNYPKNVPNVKQSEITEGTTYYTKMWRFKEKRNVLKNMKKFHRNINNKHFLENRNQLKLVLCTLNENSQLQ